MSDTDTRYQLSFFPMFDYKSIEDDLAAMAVKGWKIEHVGTFLWRFKRVEPSNKKFCVVFAKEASDYSAMPVGSQKLLEVLYKADGWEKEIQWKHMQIFCADESTVSLEMDEAARIDSVYTVMNKVYIPSWAILFFGMLMVAYLNGMKYFGNFPYCDAGTVWVFLIALYITFIAGVVLLGYLFWVKVSKKKISEGGTCIRTIWHRRLLKVLLIGFLALIVAYFMNT